MKILKWQFIRMVAFVMLIAAMTALFSGCLIKSDEELIKDRMESFLKAYNSGNMEQTLESLDAKTRNTYRSAMNVGNALIGLTGFGIGISDLFGLGIGLAGGTVLELRDMEIEIVSDAKAYVTAIMNYQDLQESYSKSVKFTLVKEDGDWFICG